MAGEYEVIADPAAIPSRIVDPQFDPERTVLLEEAPGFESVAGDTTRAGRVVEMAYDANRVEITVEAERPCLLVHAENWFPYWSVLVDGVG